ncbi:MAG: radical SAM protein, partial [Aeromicrobium sp.]
MNLTAPAAFHVMSKPTGAICNLDCEYCFFLSKDQLYPGSGFRMEAHVHEAYISQLLAAHVGAEEVVVAFQGGEPTLMGLEFFRRTLELEEQFRRPGQRILNTIQTNGTLLDDEWGVFLRENDFLVGLSIDGPRAMHDAYRVDKGGKPSFDRVMRGLDVLRRHGADWNALTTVNSANGDHGREVYTFLRDELGAQFIQLIPIVERVTAELLPLAESGWGTRSGDRPLYRQEGDLVTHRTVGARAYGRFLIDVF